MVIRTLIHIAIPVCSLLLFLPGTACNRPGQPPPLAATSSAAEGDTARKVQRPVDPVRPLPPPVLDQAIPLSNLDTQSARHIRKQLYEAHLQNQEGDYSGALATYDTVRSLIDRDPGFQPYLARLYSGLGNLYWKIGNYDTAISYFSKALSIADRNPADSLSNVIVNSNLGLFLSYLGYHKIALRHLHKAASLSRNPQDIHRLGRIYLNIGVAYGQTEHPDSLPKAEHYIRRALSIARHMGDTLAEIAALTNMGLVHTRKNENDSALLAYQTALRHRTPPGGAEIPVLLNLADLYNSLGQVKKAAGYLEQGVQRGRGSLRERDRLYYRMGIAYHRLGKYKASNKYLLRTLETTDSINHQNIEVEVQRIQNRYEHAKTEKEKIENRLLIARQEAIIQRKTLLSYMIMGAMLLSTVFIWILYAYRRRLQRQRERQRLETAAWEASIEGEERERRRLAHHLHDQIAGNLSTLRAWLEKTAGPHHAAFEATTAPGEPGLLHKGQAQNYQDALQLLDETLTEVRNTAHHLMPALLLRMGLVEAVRVFCSNVQRATGLFIRYHYFGFIDIQDKNKELIIYRCIQELIQNIIKHAGASQALVQLSRHNDVLMINVEDDGEGGPADSHPEEQAGGIGLKGMRENIEKIGGRFHWASEPGKGVSVEIEIQIFDGPE